jgi:hypothetical protein
LPVPTVHDPCIAVGKRTSVSLADSCAVSVMSHPHRPPTQPAASRGFGSDEPTCLAGGGRAAISVSPVVDLYSLIFWVYHLINTRRISAVVPGLSPNLAKLWRQWSGSSVRPEPNFWVSAAPVNRQLPKARLLSGVKLVVACRYTVGLAWSQSWSQSWSERTPVAGAGRNPSHCSTSGTHHHCSKQVPAVDDQSLVEDDTCSLIN